MTIEGKNYTDHCYYHGHIQDVEDSAISVSLCSGIRGFVRAQHQVYLIEPLEGSTEGEHALYRQEHLRRRRRAACGHSNGTVYDLSPRISALFKEKPRHLLGPQVTRFVEMFLVVDHSEFKNFGRSMQTTESRMLEIANHVDKLYRPLNIRVMLVGLEIWTDRDQIDVSPDPDETLTRFLKWRRESLLKKKKHDNAQFVTGVEFDGPTVGLATKFAMCTESSGAVNEDHNKNPIGVASTIAHEMGHNLGMSHDTASCLCGPSLSSKKCVMSETVGLDYPEFFSTCSQAELKSFLETTNPSCLLNVPETDQLFGGPVCGNAFVEPGEECDCGTVEECRNPCCNASTCRLAEGAECAEGECCSQCQFKPAGSLCRNSAGDCDLVEYCTGQVARCPKDAFKMNGIPCNFNQGYCYNGQCPTLTQHCRRLWGAGAQVAVDACFQDVKCGKIFCTGGNEYPITRHKATLSLGRTRCNSAVDLSEADDLGMVPTGTKCGLGKVCYDNTCQGIEIYGTEGCSAKCNNHGVCNHENQCHCDPGWATPYCNVKLSEFSTGVPLCTLISVLFLHRKAPHSSGLCNPLFHDSSARGSPSCGTPQISRPTFIESSVKQKCSPLHITVVPTRPAPEVRAHPSNILGQLVAKPLPPSRPLPPLNLKPVSHNFSTKTAGVILLNNAVLLTSSVASVKHRHVLYCIL
uniref:ADAM metallopeptidase domain 8a n=1 Tax=Scleropages formosus TaxID=113540 RepID=A0A8C9VZU6_SCLFO